MAKELDPVELTPEETAATQQEHYDDYRLAEKLNHQDPEGASLENTSAEADEDQD